MPVMPSQNRTVVVTSGKELIREALGLIGVFDMGEELDAAQLMDCLRSLNYMLDSWNTEILNMHARNREVFPIVAGTQAYTMGEGGDFNTYRTPKLVQNQVFIKDGDLELPLECYTYEQWGNIRYKNTVGKPCAFYHDAAFALSNISLYPVPDKDYELVLYTWNLLTQIAQPAQLFSMAPGYTEAIAYNLAIRLAPKFGKQVPAEVVAIANETRGNFKRLNLVRPTMRVDDAIMPYVYGGESLVGGGGSVSQVTVIVVNTDYVLPEFFWLLVEASGGTDGITLTLPSAPRTGMVCTVIKMDGDDIGPVTITGAGPQLPFTLTNRDQTVTFMFDGTLWVRQANT